MAVAIHPVLKPAGGSSFTERYSSRERAAPGGVVERRPGEAIPVDRTRMRCRRRDCGGGRRGRPNGVVNSMFKISTTKK